MFDLAETIPGPSTQYYGELSKQFGVVLVTSLFEKRAPGLYHNTAVVFEKDGTKNLIEAFEKLPLSYDLILTGHGHYEPQAIEAAKKNSNIIFLGQVDKITHYSLIRGSTLAINPRHYRKELDERAVPSKVMEYLTYGNCVVSTLSTPIKESFPDDINWFEGSLIEFLQSHLDSEGNLVNLKENHAQKRVIELFGEEESARVLREFLMNF